VKNAEEEEVSVAENRVRVVAYSDSDSDVESHFQRVKTHLLPAIDSLDIKPDVKSKGGKNEEKQEETKGEEVVEKDKNVVCLGWLEVLEPCLARCFPCQQCTEARQYS
jgi:hypothetical protein